MIVLAIFVLIGFMILLASASVNPTQSADPGINISKEQTSGEGDQILEITAKGGYRPSELIAKAGQPILLRVNTKSTYDCSASFTIPKFGISKVLPADGVTEFKLPAQVAGTEIQGSCSMRMYFFKIKVV